MARNRFKITAYLRGTTVVGWLRSSHTFSCRCILAATAILAPCVVHAQADEPSSDTQSSNSLSDAPSAPVALEHAPLKASELPYPGADLKLLVTLKNTKESTLPLRAVMVRDGQLLDLTVPVSAFSQNEEPQYEVTIPSPRAEISYQFYFTNADGLPIQSARYLLQRKCKPNTSLTPLSVDAKLQGDERLRTIIRQTKGLERDFANYEKALALLGELKKFAKE